MCGQGKKAVVAAASERTQGPSRQDVELVERPNKDDDATGPLPAERVA